MSKFYGSLQGNRGVVTRGGSNSSGIKSSLQSWNGSVISQLSYNDNNELCIRVEVSKGSNRYGDLVFSGTVDEFITKLKKPII
jgi:hypothetical protein